eukprot:320557-Amphidinium_carterae.1
MLNVEVWPTLLDNVPTVTFLIACNKDTTIANIQEAVQSKGYQLQQQPSSCFQRGPGEERLDPVFISPRKKVHAFKTLQVCAELKDANEMFLTFDDLRIAPSCIVNLELDTSMNAPGRKIKPPNRRIMVLRPPSSQKWKPRHGCKLAYRVRYAVGAKVHQLQRLFATKLKVAAGKISFAVRHFEFHDSLFQAPPRERSYTSSFVEVPMQSVLTNMDHIYLRIQWAQSGNDAAASSVKKRPARAMEAPRCDHAPSSGNQTAAAPDDQGRQLQEQIEHAVTALRAIPPMMTRLLSGGARTHEQQSALKNLAIDKAVEISGGLVSRSQAAIAFRNASSSLALNRASACVIEERMAAQRAAAPQSPE